MRVNQITPQRSKRDTLANGTNLGGSSDARIEVTAAPGSSQWSNCSSSIMCDCSTSPLTTLIHN
jgi:hypothetical protein